MKLTATRVIFLLGVVLAILTLTVVDSKKCKEPEACSRKRRDRAKIGKSRARRGKSRGKTRTPVAPYWKSGPPKIKEHVVREATNVKLACQVKGRPSPSFTWLVNGIVYSKKKFKRLRQRRHRLTIKRIHMNDTGHYTCIANNSVASLNFTFTVRVLDNMPLNDIHVVDEPENQTSHVGDTVTFLCRSRDWPTPRVHWTRKTVGKHAREVVKMPDGSTQGAVLVLHNVTKKDSGQYSCVISNGKTNKQLTATLNVIDESETLPYEPPCSLHIRYQTLSDHSRNCKTAEPVEMRYCMGACGRSYYIPHLVVPDDTFQMPHLNQTCQCCVGNVESLKLVNLTCPLGQVKKAFYPLIHSCLCQTCSTKDKIPPPEV